MTETPVEWTATARQDLRSIVRYIARDSRENAQGVLARLEIRSAALAGQRERGRVVPELRAIGVLHYQELIERPWRIVYRVQADRVLVLAVLDGRRSLSALLMERLVRS
ncbi:type II toxin-antitoxin system RelE/ParE family toxin [uncultured Thiodictyon sp.]|uniref:type II toxin-antitoxin system RelE/ParE family toxin n=1 Tax=uncultured Thiodictyon sp. TaxID=1846217 RepID=UPI0025F7EDAC|nr:type II toxin-antitoxin system RelE/ParE family toxin [uncultured Thiodictyon sp.]